MSPFAAKVHCFLVYKQLPFTRTFIAPMQAKQQLPLGVQVPVLQVGNQAKADSSPIGLWLDELFPETRRLLPADPVQRQQLLSIDQWVTQRVIPVMFRAGQQPGFNFARVRNAWRLAHIMHKTAQGGLPLWLRWSWPLVLANVAFLKPIIAASQPHLPMAQVRQQLYQEFIGQLNGGPFLGGNSVPSLPDIAAYPQFILPYVAGLAGAEEFVRLPEINAWLTRVSEYLPGHEPLLPSQIAAKQFP